MDLHRLGIAPSGMPSGFVGFLLFELVEINQIGCIGNRVGISWNLLLV